MWIPNTDLSQGDQLAEFDQWVTPALGDIRVTSRFLNELESSYAVLLKIADSIAETGNLTEALRNTIAEALELDQLEADTELNALIAFLFMLTSKSDNATKCQYPIWYRSLHGSTYPSVARGAVARGAVPSVLKSVDLVKNGLRLASMDKGEAVAFVSEYANFLLASEGDANQVLSIVEASRALEKGSPGSTRHLLAPLVSFHVRGSVAASGGHDPEQIVRSYLLDWGLEPESHFNVADATAASLSNWLVANGDDDSGRRAHLDATGLKTRAFDFIIPNRLPGFTKRIFIQSQFYAGDSGSVSHKNVDQAGVARSLASQIFPDAIFVELVDGAGYCGSLRRDLQHLLFAEDTHDFVQVRSIPVRLRRLIQQIGLITPLDVSLRVAEGVDSVASLLADIEGAVERDVDIEELIVDLEAAEWIVRYDQTLSVHPRRHDLVAKYRLLDEIISVSRKAPIGDRVLVPGFGPDFGASLDSTWDADLLGTLVESGIVILTGP